MSKDIQKYLNSLLPLNSTWDWDWRELEHINGFELRAVYRGETKAILRTQFSYGMVLRKDTDKILNTINKMLETVERESIRIDTPLFKALQELK